MRTPPTPLGWFVALVPLTGAAWVVAETPLPIVLAAVLPALCYAAVLVRIGRLWRARVGVQAVAFAFAWGAGVAALGSGQVNDLLLARVGHDGMLVPVLGAPLVEEGAKAAVLLALVLIWRDELRGVREGIVAGGLVGLGFAVAENVGYLMLAALQGGPAGLLRGVWVRGLLEGGVHAVFAASAGAGVGYARAPGAGGRVLAVLVGFGAAVAQHVAWNGMASRVVTDILCNPTAPDGPCQASPDTLGLVVTIPLVVVAALGPGTLALVALARRRARAATHAALQ